MTAAGCNQTLQESVRIVWAARVNKGFGIMIGSASTDVRYGRGNGALIVGMSW